MGLSNVLFNKRQVAAWIAAGATVSGSLITIMPGCFQSMNSSLHAVGNSEFKSGLNVLIFNATEDDMAHQVITRTLSDVLPKAILESEAQWVGKHEIKGTRIYYLGTKNRQQARLLQDRMGGSVGLVDYDAQHQEGLQFRDKANGQVTRIVSIQPNRDLVIFVGADYRLIVDRMRTFQK